MSDAAYGVVHEDSTFAIMARFEVNGSIGTQSDVSTIALKAWDTNDYETTVIDSALTVSDVVYDSLQTDGRWDADNTGYNFRYDVADSVCVTPGSRYRFEAVLTTSGGKLPPLVWEVACKETRSS